MLLSTLSPPEVMALTQQPVDRLKDPIAVLLAYGSLYAQRGGGWQAPSQAIRKAWG